MADYGAKYAQVYRQGRRLSQRGVDQWMEALAEFVPERPGLVIVDLGSGTGRFAVPIAERFGALVVGVEPSETMRAQAMAGEHPESVSYLAGSAETIPMPDGSCDVVFASMVLHHLTDLAAGLREVVRVLKPEGLLIVRGCHAGRLDCVRMYEFFPSARKGDEARLPRLERVVECCAGAGLVLVEARMILQEIDANLAAHCERLKLRAVSSFEFVPEAEYVAGMAAMEKAAREPAEDRPVMDGVDLVVFRRAGL